MVRKILDIVQVIRLLFKRNAGSFLYEGHLRVFRVSFKIKKMKIKVSSYYLCDFVIKNDLSLCKNLRLSTIIHLIIVT